MCCDSVPLGNREGPFYDRVVRWKEAKELEASMKKQQVRGYVRTARERTSHTALCSRSTWLEFAHTRLSRYQRVLTHGTDPRY